MSTPSTAPQEFANEWIRALTAAAPDAIVGRTEDVLTVRIQLPRAVQLTVSLLEVWQQDQGEFSPSEHVADVLAFREPLVDTATLRSLVIPVVLPQDQIARIQPAVLGEWPLGGDLQVMLSLERDGLQRPVLASERRALGERPLLQAVENVQNRGVDLSTEMLSDGLLRLRLDGTHDSVLLLLTSLWDTVEDQLGGPILITHPEHDMLLCCREDHPENVSRLLEARDAGMNDPAARHRTGWLLRWRDHDWMTVEPSRRCGVCGWTSTEDTVKCPSCGTPLDEDRFLAWSVSGVVIAAFWLFLCAQADWVLPSHWLAEAALTVAFAGPLGYALSLWRAQREEPWRPSLRDAEANLLDRTARVPLIAALAFGWAASPALLQRLAAPNDGLPAMVYGLLWGRDAAVILLGLALPAVLIWRHGARWMDPRPESTLQ